MVDVSLVLIKWPTQSAREGGVTDQSDKPSRRLLGIRLGWCCSLPLTEQGFVYVIPFSFPAGCVAGDPSVNFDFHLLSAIGAAREHILLIGHYA